MNNKNRAPIRLSIGDESWEGWTFGPYGRSREWRLHGPDGSHYTRNELADLRAQYLSISWLQVQLRQVKKDLAEARKNEVFFRRQVVMEAKLGLALIFP